MTQLRLPLRAYCSKEEVEAIAYNELKDKDKWWWTNWWPNQREWAYRMFVVE